MSEVGVGTVRRHDDFLLAKPYGRGYPIKDICLRFHRLDLRRVAIEVIDVSHLTNQSQSMQ